MPCQDPNCPDPGYCERTGKCGAKPRATFIFSSGAKDPLYLQTYGRRWRILGYAQEAGRIDRSLTPEQEADFFAGRPVPSRPPGPALFWGLLAWALALASVIGAYCHV